MGKKKKDDDSIWNLLLGVGLGIIGYTIFSEIVKPRCPVCNTKVEPKTPKCPNCKNELEWKKRSQNSS